MFRKTHAVEVRVRCLVKLLRGSVSARRGSVRARLKVFF